MNFSKLYFKQGIIFVFIAVSWLSVACGGNSSSAANKKEGNRESQATKSENPIQVTTTKVIVREVPAYIQSTGSLISDEISDVAPQTSGQIVATLVNVGDYVRQGDVFARVLTVHLCHLNAPTHRLVLHNRQY